MRKARVIMGLVLAVALLSACVHMTETRVNVSASPVIDRIPQKGELVVGTDGNMPPLSMTTKEGEIIGLEADLARYMAKSMGVTLRFEVMPFSELLPALEAGKVDMILSGVTITPERNLKVAFVGPYFISGQAFLTNSETIARVKDASDIDSPDTTLAAVKGTTSQILVEEELPKAKLVTTEDYDEAVDLVIQDKVDALIADYPICLIYPLRRPVEGLVAVIAPLTYEPIGIALPPNDPLLVNWVENVLNMLKGSGELKALQKYWFKDASWLEQLP
ncbi:MAG: transporter substrate-binding domain-containing protein [Desulfobacterales bacterium]|nr:MAG: transporter substrate-binding domain-containing protein [Desulfobacterales bacterium]